MTRKSELWKNMVFGSRLLLALAVLVLQPATSDAQAQRSARRNAPSPRPKEKMNAWTVGPPAACLRCALRPRRRCPASSTTGRAPCPAVVTRGPRKPEFAALPARCRYSDHQFRRAEEYKLQVPDIRVRITYLLNLTPSELHILSGPNRLQISPKKVNFNTQVRPQPIRGRDLQPPRHQCRKTSFRIRLRWNRCAKARWQRSSSSRRSRLTPS